MEKIQIELTEDVLRKGIDNAITSILKSDYSNPFFDIVKKAIEEQKPTLDKFVSEIISNAILDVNFKEKMSNLVIQKMIESTFKK